MSNNKNTLFLKDYKKPAFSIEHVHLLFEIEKEKTLVTNCFSLVKINAQEKDLILDGVGLKLVSLEMNGKVLTPSEYQIADDQLIIANVDSQIDLKVITELSPDKNKSFEGLYRSGPTLVTQNEAQGFRKITYFLDRPDVMTSYKTTIIADREEFPVLLSNGNLLEEKTLDNGKHLAVWQDPHKKPCYLFALVAGRLGKISDHFITRSGKKVELGIYCDPGNENRCDHAMTSLKLSMKWDEENYDREYDLDIYNIVAVDNFNAGAMENKGLNIFNSVYILADHKTAVDRDYQNIMAVIAHEYFHNWTGNRITLRDWFQLSLKEGLTVFRDQEFSMDIKSKAVQRIQDVNTLRTRQFAEDAGPTAHPVRPQSVISVDNFFTVTIYEKGAEVIRMIKTLVGDEGFRQGMSLYFDKYDGMAVTTEDFVAAFEEANSIDLTQFKLWYDQSGTPALNVKGSYNEKEEKYELAVEQTCQPTPDQKNKKPFHIPLSVALLDKEGNEFPNSEKVLHIKGNKQSFAFSNITEKPTPSLLRGFSAPVTLNFEYSESELAFLMSHDKDPFCRWEACQRLTLKCLLSIVDDIKNGRSTETASLSLVSQAFGHVLDNREMDPAFQSLLLTLPDESYISQFLETIDVEAIHRAREEILTEISSTHQEKLLEVYNSHNVREPHSIDPLQIGKRSLKNTALALLSKSPHGHGTTLALEQLNSADNMTDEYAALIVLLNHQDQRRKEASSSFYEKWKSESLVMNKWLRSIGSSPYEGTLKQIKECMNDPVFDIENPNKVYSLLMSFTVSNPTQFHSKSGDSYHFIADQIIKIDKINPHVGSHLAGSFNHWKKFSTPNRELMKEQLERVSKEKDLSKNTYEIISKNLAL